MQDVQEPTAAGKPPSALRPFVFVLGDALELLPVHAMPPTERAVLTWIATHAGRDGAGAFPSMQRLSRLTGFGMSTIVRAVEELVKRRWLRRVARFDERTKAATSNLYTVLLDGEPWGDEQAIKRRRQPPPPPLRAAARVPAGPRRAAVAPSPPGGSPPLRPADTPIPPGGHPYTAGRQRTSHEPPMNLPFEPPMNPSPESDVSGSMGEVESEDHQPRREGPSPPRDRPALAALCVPPAGEGLLEANRAPVPRPEPESPAPPAKSAPAGPPPAVQPTLPGLGEHVAPAEPPDPCAEVWAAYLQGREWARVGGGLPILTDARRKLVHARLAEGFDVEDLACAARGLWRSDYHLEGGFTGIEYALRNAKAVETHREKGRPPKVETPATPAPTRVIPTCTSEQRRATWDRYKHELGGGEYNGG